MKKIIAFLASGLGLGYIPFAPGTFGTLLGLFLAMVSPDNILLISFISIAGIWLAHEAEKIFGEHDSPKIVIDEVAGYLIGAYHYNGLSLIYVFFIFRIFDILKPFPIKQLQKLPGGMGVMVDDLAAGVLTNLIMFLTVYLLN